MERNINFKQQAFFEMNQNYGKKVKERNCSFYALGHHQRHRILYRIDKFGLAFTKQINHSNDRFSQFIQIQLVQGENQTEIYSISIMGCILTLQKAPQKGKIQIQPTPHTSTPPIQPGTKTETASTLGTSSRIVNNKLIKKPSAGSGESGFSTYGESSILRGDILQLSNRLIPINVSGPGPGHETYNVNCESESVPIYLQMIQGYPFENVIWINKETKKPHPSQITSFKTQQAFILKENITIFVKLKLECQSCSKKQIFTSCKTVFDLKPVACDCPQPTPQKVALIELAPDKAKLWSEDSKIIFQKNLPVEISAQGDKLRVVGCTNCWKLSNLRDRGDCDCSVCSQCLQSECKICMM